MLHMKYLNIYIVVDNYAIASNLIDIWDFRDNIEDIIKNIKR